MDCINHPLLSMWVGSGQSIALYLPSWRRIAVRLVHTPKVHPIMLCFVGRTDGMWSKNNNTDNTRMTWTKLLLLLHLNVQQRWTNLIKGEGRINPSQNAKSLSLGAGWRRKENYCALETRRVASLTLVKVLVVVVSVSIPKLIGEFRENRTLCYCFIIITSALALERA